MLAEFKPQTYTSVSPYLIVTDLDEAVAFLEAVFGARELRRERTATGAHAEVRLDDSVIMLGLASPEWTIPPAHIHVYVPDVDATFQRALDAGGVVVQEPMCQGDDDKRGGVKDPWGVTWWIATRVRA